jgi:hypothetical protein
MHVPASPFTQQGKKLGLKHERCVQICKACEGTMQANFLRVVASTHTHTLSHLTWAADSVRGQQHYGTKSLPNDSDGGAGSNWTFALF